MSGLLKFRAWDKRAGKWQANWSGMFPWGTPEGNRACLIIGIMPDYYEFNQFTDIIDRNGKTVCDKDIVRTFGWGGQEELVGVVSQDSPQAWYFQGFKDFAGTYKQGDKHQDTFCYGTVDSALFHCKERCEIIGNIYENPELLEVTP